MLTLRLDKNVRTTPEVARFVAELIGEPTLYSKHRRGDVDQVSVERHTFTTMDQQQRLFADAVERILSEPFTVRELVILSPYARERRAAGQALASPAGQVPGSGVVLGLECHVVDVVSHRAMVSENCLGTSRKDTNARWLLTSLPSSSCSGN